MIKKELINFCSAMDLSTKFYLWPKKLVNKQKIFQQTDYKLNKEL